MKAWNRLAPATVPSLIDRALADVEQAIAIVKRDPLGQERQAQVLRATRNNLNVAKQMGERR